MKSVYLVSAQRTPVGRFLGAFKTTPAPLLGAVAIKAVLAKAGIAGADVSEVIFGEVLTAGVGQAPARQALIHAGIPVSVPATTVGKVCGSGLKTVMLGTQSILLGDAEVVVAGGQENMSLAPHLLQMVREGYRMGNKEVTDSMVTDGLWDPYNQMHMGSCAESCAKEFSISREQQDAFAAESYRRARHAIEQGWFKNEIAPVQVTSGKTQMLVEADEEPGFADLAKMPSLRPAFDKEGTITAANASKINDGAAAVVLASEDAVKRLGLKPMAKIRAYATHAQDPKWFTTAPVEAMKKVLAKAGLRASDVGLFEINEAFALVVLAAMQQLEIPHNKVNIHGGACAIGHPIGASGARILTTLAFAMQRNKVQTGLATLCIGGGEAVAVILESV